MTKTGKNLINDSNKFIKGGFERAGFPRRERFNSDGTDVHSKFYDIKHQTNEYVNIEIDSNKALYPLTSNN